MDQATREMFAEITAKVEIQHQLLLALVSVLPPTLDMPGMFQAWMSGQTGDQAGLDPIASQRMDQQTAQLIAELQQIRRRRTQQRKKRDD